MNKVFNILVLIVFLLSFIGIHIHKHYSGGKLYSMAVFAEAESCCADMEQCEMTKVPISCEDHHQKDDCSCKDETDVLKISDDFIVKEFSFIDISVISLFIVTLCDYTGSNVLFANETDHNSLPPLIKSDVLAEYCVYII